MELEVEVINKGKKKVQIKSNKVREVLKELGVNPVTCVVVVNGQVVVEQEEVNRDDELEIHSVMSSG